MSPLPFPPKSQELARQTPRFRHGKLSPQQQYRPPTTTPPTQPRQCQAHYQASTTRPHTHHCHKNYNYLAYDFTVRPFPLSPPLNHAITHPTLQGLATCTTIVAWSIYQPTITTAVLAAPTQLAILANWAWAVPGCPTMCFAFVYSVALWAIFGTSTTAQFVRGCSTDA